MPLWELGGLNLDQSSAVIRHLAQRGDHYGDGDREALWCDMIAGAVARAEIAIQTAFQPTTEIVIAAMQARVAKFRPRLEARLASNGGDFCVGNRLSFADIVLVEAFIAYVERLPDLVAEMLGLAGLQNRVLEHGGIATYLGSEQRYPQSERRLCDRRRHGSATSTPTALPDTDRFVVRAEQAG